MARDDYDDVGPSATKGKPWGIPTVEGDVHKYYDKMNSTVDYNITPSTTTGPWSICIPIIVATSLMNASMNFASERYFSSHLFASIVT